MKHVKRAAEVVVDRVDADCLLRHCEVPKAHAGSITAIVSTPQGIYSASQDNTLKRWKPAPGPGGRYSLTPELEVNLEESCFSLLHQDTWIFCGLWNGNIRAFSQDGTDIQLQGHTKAVRAMLIHEGILITGGQDETIRLWSFDAASKRFNPTHTIKDGLPGEVRKLKVMGGALVIGGSNGVAMCNLQTLTVAKILPPIKFVADFLEYEGHLIVAYNDGSMRVFDAEGNLKKENQPTAAGQILSMGGLESGPRVVCTHNHGKMSIVDLPSFEPRLHWQAFEGGRVESVMCAGHDGLFMVGHQHGNLQLWQRAAPAGGGMMPPQLM